MFRPLLSATNRSLAAVTVAGNQRLAQAYVSTRSKHDVIGFIGLGNMGAHMARNLAKNNKRLILSDISMATAESLAKEVGQGATVAGSPDEVAAQTTTVITMLPSNPEVEQVYTGDSGLLKTAQEGSLFIDCSTIEPSVAEKVSAQAREQKTTMIDAPVSGGVGGAAAGTLTFMVGSPADTFKEAEAILSLMGKNVVHCGDVGAGQVVKICNNMLLGITMMGVSETMNLGVSLGVDPKLLASVINTSTGRCWSSDSYNPCPGVMEGVPSSRDYEGGFGSALMAKDLRLAISSACTSRSSVPLGALALQLYEIMSKQGYARKDFSSAYDFLSKQQKD